MGVVDLFKSTEGAPLHGDRGYLPPCVARIMGIEDEPAGRSSARRPLDRRSAVTKVRPPFHWGGGVSGVGGADVLSAELARLKGEMEAIEQASIRKNCGVQFRRAQG